MKKIVRYDPRTEDLRSRLIILENKIEDATTQLFRSQWYVRLPDASAEACRMYIAGTSMETFSAWNVPAYEMRDFDRKCGLIRRWAFQRESLVKALGNQG